MTLKTPSFWYRKPRSKPPIGEILLYPVSWLYGRGVKMNQHTQPPHKVDIPVLCIGNLVAGGSGKTPTAISLLKLTRGKKIFKNPHFLTRGYGGSERGPVLVDYFKHNAAQVGDESLLLAKTGYTIVSADRKDGAEFAVKHKADCIIMDDGLQNKALHKDISITVIDGAVGFGNCNLMPAGPLREPLADGFAKTDAFVLIGKDKTGAVAMLPEDKPLFQAHIEVDKEHKPPTMKKYVAFAGLGRPEKFYHLLQKLGYNLVGWHTFADHYVYKSRDLQKLADEAASQGAELLTTEKDFQRIPDTPDLGVPLNHLPITLVWEDEEAVLDFIAQKLKS